MIPVLFTMWAIAAPMGYLVGDVYAHKNKLAKDGMGQAIPYACAILTPLGALIALVVMTQISTKTENDE